MNTVLTVKRGDTTKWNITAVDGDGAALVLTGGTLRFTVKTRASDLDNDAIIAKSTGSGITHTDPTGGLAQLVVAAADTSAVTKTLRGLKWDLQFTSASGEVYTLQEGTMDIVEDITLTTP
jgi:hypothetical protein